MASHPRRTSERVDGDGVRIVETRGRRDVWLVVAIGVVSVALVLVLRSARRTSPGETVARAAGGEVAGGTPADARAAGPPAAGPSAAAAAARAERRVPST
jgi:hypothetical protein